MAGTVYLPRVHEVRQVQTVPDGMLQNPIRAGTIVHKDHEHNGNANEEEENIK